MADITITGNSTEPTMRYTQSGKAVLSFSVAENHRKKIGNDWEDDGTTFWRVTAWERQAEALADHIQKGTRVVVTGQVRSREWDKDGEKRTSYDVTARHVGIIPKAQQSQTGPAPAGGQQGDPWGTSGNAGAGFANDAAPF